MAEARQRNEWNHTASLMALVHNVNTTKRHQMKRPAHFHPMCKRRRAAKLGKKESLAALKAAFIRE